MTLLVKEMQKVRCAGHVARVFKHSTWMTCVVDTSERLKTEKKNPFTKDN